MMRILVTGTNSGLGKWLSTQFVDCDKFTRESKIKDFPKNAPLNIELRSAIENLLLILEELKFAIEKENLFSTESSRSHSLNQKIDLIKKLEANGIINFAKHI